MPKIFISYRRKDSAGYAGRLAESLARRSRRHQVFIDVHIPAGNDFHHEIENGVKSCDVVLVLIGPSWLIVRDANGARRLDDPEDHLRLEIEFALRNGVRVVPVLVGGAEVPAEQQLPDSLRTLTRYQAVELSDERWDYDLGRLTRAFGLSPWEPRTLLLVASAVLVVGVALYFAVSGAGETVAAGDSEPPAQAKSEASAEVLALTAEPRASASASGVYEASAPATPPSSEPSSAVEPPPPAAMAAAPRAVRPAPQPIYKAPAPTRVNVAPSDHVWLYADASGLRLAFVEPKSARSDLHFPGLRLFVGREGTFEEVPIYKTKGDGSGWLVELEDVRTSFIPDSTIALNEGKAVVACKSRKLEFPRVPADGATSIVSSSTFWDHARKAFVLALGQDSRGEYTLVDSGSGAFSIFRGVERKMRRVAKLPSAAVERKHTPFGFVYSTPEGILQADQTPNMGSKLTWKNASTSETLVQLNPVKNWRLIFESLGIYPKGRYYSPCDTLDSL